MQPGKSCGYEEDINIPLIIRGPGVAANETTDIVTTHTDLAPTFFKLLGIPHRPDFDGAAIPVTKSGIAALLQSRREHVNIEYWGFAGGEGIYDRRMNPIISLKFRLTDLITDELPENNTYKATRIIGPRYSLYYSIWCNNEHALYDMNVMVHPWLSEEGSNFKTSARANRFNV